MLTTIIEELEKRFLNEMSVEEIAFRNNLSYKYLGIRKVNIINKIKDKFNEKTKLLLSDVSTLKAKGVTEIIVNGGDKKIKNYINYADFTAYNIKGEKVSLAYDNCKLLSEILIKIKK